MNDKLKPCPFCGGKAILSGSHTVADETFELRFVFCESCCTETRLYSTKQKAIDAWNRRAEPTFTLDELDAIRRMFDEQAERALSKFKSITDKCAAALKGARNDTGNI